MKVFIVLGAIVAVAMCHNSPDASRPVLKFSDVDEGNVDVVKTSLAGHIKPHQLDKFLNIISKWQGDSTVTETLEGIRNFTAIAFASKSNTSETDWIKFMSGDLSMLTKDELRFIRRPAGDPRYTKWRTTKDVLKFRMNPTDADLMTLYVGGMQLENRKNRLFAMKQMLIIVLSALSGQPESETQHWVLMDDENSEWYRKNILNAEGVRM